MFTDASKKRLGDFLAHWFRYVFSLFLCGPPSSLAYSEVTKKYIQTIEDFKYHTAHHIQNVMTLGLYLFNSFSHSFFSDLTAEEVIDYLALHDLSKRMTARELAEFGYSNEKSLAERLFEFYGKDKNSLPEKQRQKLEEIIQELNRIDRLITQKYLFSKGYIKNGKVSAKGLKLLMIEKISDLVERTKNPVSIEEFGKIMKSPTEYTGDTRYRRLVRVLMDNYGLITNNQYRDILESRTKITSCETFFK